MYRVAIDKRAAKEILGLPSVIAARVNDSLQALGTDPRPPGCKKLIDSREHLWRIRIGDYRVVYLIDDGIRVVEIRKAGHRKDIYL